MEELDIAELVELVQGSCISLLRVRSGDTEVLISKGPLTAGELATSGEARTVDTRTVAVMNSLDVEPTPGASRSEPVGASRVPVMDSAGLTAAGEQIVRAPVVGVFYRAPSPGELPFVEVGSVVAEGATIGLIEAMKIFTAVAAEMHGVVQAVLVSDGAFVEFGQPLLRLESVTPAERAVG